MLYPNTHIPWGLAVVVVTGKFWALVGLCKAVVGLVPVCGALWETGVSPQVGFLATRQTTAPDDATAGIILRTCLVTNACRPPLTTRTDLHMHPLPAPVLQYYTMAAQSRDVDWA